MTQVTIRPVRPTDLEQLYQLACQAGPGMTNFPPDMQLLEQKIAWSTSSFNKQVTTPDEEYYFFVMEAQAEQQVVGCCALFSRAGANHPFYSYKISKEKVFSEVVGIDKWIEVLHLVHDFHDSSEIGTLFLEAHYRKNKLGEFLSRVRFLFLACFRERFTQTVIAEMRGNVDDNGISPFWDGLCRHFFDMDFLAADTLCSQGKKQFIVDLMPRCPIYVPLLSASAQATMGEVHENTRPALALLHKEGFRYENYIDIFDGGPTVGTRTEEITTVRNAFLGQVSTIVRHIVSGEQVMICNARLDFRACIARIQRHDEIRIALDEHTARQLGVEQGDTVRIAEFPL